MARETRRFQKRRFHLGKALKDEQDLNRQREVQVPCGRIIEVLLAPESILPLLSSPQS